MFKKGNCLQDFKNRTTPPDTYIYYSPFLGRASFFMFKIDFCDVAVRKSIISGVY